MELLQNILTVLTDASLWLLVGLLFAGLVKAWIPEDLMSRWLGGSGLWPVTKAAIIGAPLPLCSCGVLPAAVGLRQGGASREATLSFLIATPETGVDSMAVTYALLGPFIAIFRPFAAISSAIFTGLVATLMLRREAPPAPLFQPNPAFGNIASISITTAPPTPPTFTKRTLDGVQYASTTLLIGIIHWILIGVVLAGVVLTIAPPDLLSTWGSGLPAMLMMILVGIPMYICATASTPIGAALLLAGMSPGTVLVFLMAGPATNIGTLAVVKKEMGAMAVYAYLIGMVISSISLGLLLDWSIQTFEVDIQAQLENSSHFVPHWLEQFAA
ncbi:MAG: SO_0444 family Cu/Zn efflux transporter, partial [Gammaproteobacteria bacterium]|nr:SO_0444 family Cu/Zn efflux transporter [Gammaproteobacteria bacterium]